MAHPDRSPQPSDERYVAALRLLSEIVHELLGVDTARIDPEISYFEMGVDSLLLIQTSQMVEARSGVTVSLFQLMEELTNLSQLAAFVAEKATDERLGLAGAESPPAAGPVADHPPAASGAVSAAPVAPPSNAEPPAPNTVAASRDLPGSLPAGLAVPADGAQLPEATLARVFARQLEALSAITVRQLQLLREASSQETRPGEAAAPVGPPAPAPPAGSSPAVAPPQPAAPDSPGQTAGPGVERGETEVYDPHEPLQTHLAGGLDGLQERHLHELIERYTKRTAGSKRIAASHRRSLADIRWTKDFRLAWKEMIYPIVGERSQGSRLWDVDGNEYVDIAMGFGLHLFGHSPDFITRALRSQLDLSLAAGPQSPMAGRAAELIAKLTGLERSIFVNSGTEAVIAALRAARTYRRRDRFARFAGAYHGWADATLVRRNLDVSAVRRSLPGAPGVPAKAVEDTLVLDWDRESGLETLEREIDTLGAVIVEPVQSRLPDVQPRRFLQEVRRLTREHGVPLIFDEMLTGFRIHPGGAQRHFGVEADLAIYGKVLAGGLPVGVVSGQAEFMNVFDGGPWDFGDDSHPPSERTLVAGAYFKNPLTMAATLATLEELERRGPEMQEALNARTEVLVSRLNDLFRRQQAPLEVVHFGSLFRFVTLEDPELHQLFFFHLVDEGVFFTRENANCFLSTAHDDQDLELICQAVERSVAEMQRGGYFPDRTS